MKRYLHRTPPAPLVPDAKLIGDAWVSMDHAVAFLPVQHGFNPEHRISGKAVAYVKVHASVVTHRCPQCGAKKGKQCVSSMGIRWTQPHYARKIVFAQTKRRLLRVQRG